MSAERTRDDGITKGTSSARVQSLNARTASRTSDDRMPIRSEDGCAAGSHAAGGHGVLAAACMHPASHTLDSDLVILYQLVRWTSHFISSSMTEALSHTDRETAAKLIKSLASASGCDGMRCWPPVAHQDGGAQHCALRWAVDEGTVRLTNFQACVFLKQRPVRLQCAGLWGMASRSDLR